MELSNGALPRWSADASALTSLFDDQDPAFAIAAR
jgi:hypothetical protein